MDIAVSWRQVHILLHLYRSEGCMHQGLLLCSLEISNGRDVILSDAFLCVERCCFSARAHPFQLVASHLPLMYRDVSDPSDTSPDQYYSSKATSRACPEP